MTTAIMRLTPEETLEVSGQWGLSDEEVTQALEEGTMRAYLDEDDFIAYHTPPTGSMSEVIQTIVRDQILIEVTGSVTRALLLLTGAIELDSGVIVAPIEAKEYEKGREI